MSGSIDPPTSSSPLQDPHRIQNPIVRPRRELFEHGFLQIPKLVLTDPVQTLSPLKQKLATGKRVDSARLAEALQISIEYARLVLEIIASVLHSDSDPLVRAKPDEIDSVGVDLHDLILFLYVQSYKRLLPKTHKNSAAVADVWPSTSAFDGCLSAMSPLQLVRTNSRRLVPSQADEEAHQLSYLQKHLANILSLLAKPVDAGSKDSLVLTKEEFEHLGFLIQFNDRGSAGIPLNDATPFFACSDSDKSAVPVPLAQIHDWLFENIASSLESITLPKENGSPSVSDHEAASADAHTSSSKDSSCTIGQTFIEGISKSSFVKQASDINGSSIKIGNCHDSVIYVLEPLKYVTIYGSSDSTIVLGAVGKAVRVEHCERVHVIAAAKRVCIANCRECVLFLGVNQRPLTIGDNHNVQVAPYNTYYPKLKEHMEEVGIEATINRWSEPLALVPVDAHDSSPHAAGVSEVKIESAACLDPDQFTNFLIPNWCGKESSGKTKDNPFPLPEPYMKAQQRNQKTFDETTQLLKETTLEENRKRELSCALHVYFRDWLYASGNVRQLYCLQGD